MSPIKQRKRSNSNAKLKTTIKYLSHCKNSKIIADIIKKSPLNVTKTICNAALNAAHGDVSLKPKERKVLAAHRPYISSLIQQGQGVSRKKHILQKGGLLLGLLIPTILSAVLSSLGSKFL